MSTDPLVVFTPSGKRGRFAPGTPVLTAARQLGVDLDSVCGGRGICSKCQITPGYGEFSKHGVTVQADALSEWNAVEERYDEKRGLKEGRRLGCQATVQGDVVIGNDQLDDMVLMRADGTPTYMLAVVVDDHDMGITHVIRGDDHLVNAFRQVQLFRAMDWDLPKFAHIPLIHGPDGAKLSKRHGALGVDAYREMGYLPEALRNYLMRLSWSHGDEEIISTEQAIEWFGLDAVGRGAACPGRVRVRDKTSRKTRFWTRS